MLAVFVIAIGLRNVGLVGYLSTLYQGASLALVGTIAAVGSALLNNHPMAIMNLLALNATPGSGQPRFSPRSSVGSRTTPPADSGRWPACCGSSAAAV
jgi:Na+/H+ antiporter NhaD/arsenite permease-like protein